MKIIENVIYREVVVVEVASSELGNSWTLAEKVRDGFLLMSTKEAFKLTLNTYQLCIEHLYIYHRIGMLFQIQSRSTFKSNRYSAPTTSYILI